VPVKGEENLVGGGGGREGGVSHEQSKGEKVQGERMDTEVKGDYESTSF